MAVDENNVPETPEVRKALEELRNAEESGAEKRVRAIYQERVDAAIKAADRIKAGAAR